MHDSVYNLFINRNEFVIDFLSFNWLLFWTERDTLTLSMEDQCKMLHLFAPTLQVIELHFLKINHFSHWKTFLEGHTRAVLSVVGTNDVLFSGSKGN